MQYLDDMKLKVSEAISRQVELWKQTNVAIRKLSSLPMLKKFLVFSLENCFISMAREAVFECMIYI